jgi:TusA-related sulfurtransferase
MVDARGLSCPEPVVLAKKALEGKPESEEVVVDCRPAVENVSRFARANGYAVTVKEDGMETHLFLKKV